MRIFIGYDSKEAIAYHVLAHSIMRLAMYPVSITPLALDNLKSIFWRPRGPLESTEFSISRFLVPFLSGYEGISIFMDCDMLVRVNIHDVLGHVDPRVAVSVVKHDYTPKNREKFLGNVQTVYPRKNWSSFMVFNNEKCKALTIDYVNSATGLDLHRFNWLPDEEIGELNPSWNHLVGEYRKDDYARVVHFTNGGPWFSDYQDCDYAEEWRAERDHAMSTKESECLSPR